MRAVCIMRSLVAPPFPVETMLRIHCLQLWWT
jgi:hypothetical protein